MSILWIYDNLGSLPSFKHKKVGANLELFNNNNNSNNKRPILSANIERQPKTALQ